MVQYQESDLDFASRLMEEEGIYYFFKFSKGAHKLVLANTPQSHLDLPGGSQVIFEAIEGGEREDERITSWTKEQHWGRESTRCGIITSSFRTRNSTPSRLLWTRSRRGRSPTS